VTARREGQVVAAAWGWSARGALELADLVVSVEHRGQGIGRHVIAAVEALARRRDCEVIGTYAAPDGAPAALLTASGFRALPSDGRGTSPRRWEHALTPVEGGE
jgi:GNAT superfamily N-acetyltransferase